MAESGPEDSKRDLQSLQGLEENSEDFWSSEENGKSEEMKWRKYGPI